MDEIILEKIKQKIRDTVSDNDEVKQLIELLSDVDNSNSFALGIVVGRIYNTFFYQSKRILNREPSKQEFDEFLKFIKTEKPTLEELW